MTQRDKGPFQHKLSLSCESGSDLSEETRSVCNQEEQQEGRENLKRDIVNSCSH